MRVSIIIPSLNSPIIDRVIRGILSQGGAELINDIVVVGQDELGLMPTIPPVKFIHTEERVSAAVARNIGVAATKADLFIFLDSDCLVQNNWLTEHLAAHEKGYDVVGGGIFPIGSGYWGLTYNLTLFHEFFTTSTEGSRDYFPTLNLSVKHKTVEAVGLMNEELVRSHDIEWTLRMARSGCSLYFTPRAAVIHAHSRFSLSKVWRDCARSGHFMRQVRLQNPDRLQAPVWLRYRWMVLLLSPVIAAGVVGRMILRQPMTILSHWVTLPGLYMTKIAWCWGASRPEEPR